MNPSSVLIEVLQSPTAQTLILSFFKGSQKLCSPFLKNPVFVGDPSELEHCKLGIQLGLTPIKVPYTKGLTRLKI